MPLLTTRSLTAGYGAAPVLREVSWSVAANERWAIIGRNGSGKSTLVKCLASLIAPLSGEAAVEGRSVSTYAPRDRARLISYVPQATGRSIPYTVRDYVMLGRYAWQGLLALPTHEDHLAADRAMELTDVAAFAERALTTLSGGEAQRVFLAGAVAQQAKIMLLDEPTSFLDPHHDAMFYQVLERIHAEYEVTVVAVTHDVNAALNRYTHVLALREGSVFFAGNVGQFMAKTPGILEDIYSVKFKRFSSADDGAVMFAPWMSCAGGQP